MTNLPRNLHKNECHVSGELFRDAEVRYTTSRKAVASLTIVTRHEQYSQYHRVVAWEKLAGKASTLRKGDFVRITGRLQNRSWDDKASGQKKYTTEVVAYQL